MDANHLATKEDIFRLERLIAELREVLTESKSNSFSTNSYLTSREVMELLKVKECGLRSMRRAGTVKFKQFGRYKRYPAAQFSENKNKK
jgi:hypothetical protein